MTKAFKYIVIFVVGINLGPALWSGMGAADATGVQLTACGESSADTITDTATSSDEVGGSGLETLWGFYTDATGFLADIQAAILPAAKTMQCNGVPSEIIAYGNGMVTLVGGLATLSYLRGFDL